MAAAAAAVAVMGSVSTLDDASASGESVPDKTIPTLPPPTTVVTGIDIPAGAGIPQMTAIVSPILGTTGDVAEELSRLADLPTGIPSPAGAMIESFGVDYFRSDEYYSAVVVFTSEATPADAIVFYRTVLTAAGFVASLDDVRTDGETRSHRLGFANPNSAYDLASVEVLVTDDDTDRIVLTIIDHVEPAVLGAFSRWAQGMPTIDGGVPV